MSDKVSLTAPDVDLTTVHCFSEDVLGFFVLYNEPTNAQLIDRLSHSFYMFRH